jgi:hypothetical protein
MSSSSLSSSTIADLDDEFEWIQLFNQIKNPESIMKCITTNADYVDVFTFELEKFLRDFLKQYPKSVRLAQVKLLLLLQQHDQAQKKQAIRLYDYASLIPDITNVKVLLDKFKTWSYASDELRDALVENIELLCLNDNNSRLNDGNVYKDIASTIYLYSDKPVDMSNALNINTITSTLPNTIVKRDCSGNISVNSITTTSLVGPIETCVDNASKIVLRDSSGIFTNAEIRLSETTILTPSTIQHSRTTASLSPSSSSETPSTSPMKSGHSRYRDYKKYALCLTYACDCDNPLVENFLDLGLCYENGVGVVQNLDRARILYLRCGAMLYHFDIIIKIYDTYGWKHDVLDSVIAQL